MAEPPHARPEPGDPGQRSHPTGLRRVVVLAGHLGDEAEARAHLADGQAALRASSLGALARMGRLTGDDVAGAFTDPAAGVRRRAAELAVGIAGVDLRPLLADPEDLVAEAAAWALGERRDRSAVAELARVTTGHDNPLCREAAVAALGAIGDDQGLPAILAAGRDRPAVRRRAVIALAAFEGPAVETALRQARQDRDWQVRQAAEDLLGEPSGL